MGLVVQELSLQFEQILLFAGLLEEWLGRGQWWLEVPEVLLFVKVL